MLSKETRHHWDFQLAELLSRDCLSKWELEFLESIDARRDKGEDLTWKQSKKLREVAEKYKIF